MFGDCIDTNVKLAGFIIGCISLFLWLVPLIPQLYENYRRKRCEAFSFFFLLFWFVYIQLFKVNSTFIGLLEICAI